MNRNFDVIVVGAGVIGISCAWRLAQQKARVCLIERDCCGTGASKASLGVLAPHSPLQTHTFHGLHRQSLAMFPDFVGELQQESGIDPVYTRCGSIEVLPSPEQYSQASKEVRVASERSDLAKEYRLISSVELKELEPTLVSRQFGALYCSSAAEVNVEQLLLGLRQAAQRVGVTFIENCLVKELYWQMGRVQGVLTTQGDFWSDQLLVAAGAWSPLISSVIAQFSPIQPVRGQGLMLSSKVPTVRHIIKWRRGYIVPQRDSRVILGSTTEFDSGYDDSVTAGGINEVLSKALEVLPNLKSSRLERCWAGIRPAGIDRKPYLGPVPTVDNLHLATGLYKIGYGFAPLIAQALCQTILDGYSQFPINCVPPRDYEIRGLNGNS